MRKAALEAAIRKITGGKPVRTGKVKLDVPPLVDNGNTVPLSVSVDSPMTAADHVKAIHRVHREEPATLRVQRASRPARRPRAASPRARASPIPAR